MLWKISRRRVRFAIALGTLVAAGALAQPGEGLPRRIGETISSGNLTVPLPAFGQTQHTIRFGGGGAIVGIRVSVRLTHPNVRELETRLVSPSGSIAATLTAGDGSFTQDPDLGAGAPDCSGTPATFADGGIEFGLAFPPFTGTYRPDEGFSDLSEEDSLGSWRLVVINRSEQAGALHCWSVTVIRRVEVVSASGRRAELSYHAGEDEFGFPEYSNLRLRIVRGGVEALNRIQRKSCSYCEVWPIGARSGSSIRFRQLDRDPSPELIFDFFTGGASCCTVSRIYDERSGRYRETQRDWSRTGYRLVRPPRSRAPLFLSGDGAFICVLASCAFSPPPIELTTFRAGRLVDVTRSYRRLVRRDAASQWRYYQQFKRRRYEITGALAAWLADKHLLGEGREGWRVVRAIVARGEVARYGYAGPTPYVQRLARLLRRTGYMR